MLEIPGSATLARQINETVRGKTIKHVVANAAPHKLAWYCGDPAAYGALLTGRAITGSRGIGAMLEIEAEDGRIVLGDGANLRYYASREEAPDKHQLLVELDDGGALVCAVQMYGAVLAFKEGTYQDKYYVGAKSKPQPITDAFDRAYFASLYIGGRRSSRPRHFSPRSSAYRAAATARCRIFCSPRACIQSARWGRSRRTAWTGSTARSATCFPP